MEFESKKFSFFCFVTVICFFKSTRRPWFRTPRESHLAGLAHWLPRGRFMGCSMTHLGTGHYPVSNSDSSVVLHSFELHKLFSSEIWFGSQRPKKRPLNGHKNDKFPFSLLPSTSLPPFFLLNQGEALRTYQKQSHDAFPYKLITPIKLVEIVKSDKIPRAFPLIPLIK